MLGGAVGKTWSFTLSGATGGKHENRFVAYQENTDLIRHFVLKNFPDQGRTDRPLSLGANVFLKRFRLLNTFAFKL